MRESKCSPSTGSSNVEDMVDAGSATHVTPLRMGVASRIPIAERLCVCLWVWPETETAALVDATGRQGINDERCTALNKFGVHAWLTRLVCTLPRCPAAQVYRTNLE